MIQRFNTLYQRVTQSWIPVVIVIFIVFAAGILLVDDFSIQSDDLWSIGDAGYFTAISNPFSVIDNIRENSPAMVPGYFFLLSIWANLVGWSPTLLRILSIYFGIISLALIYRFGRDYISKDAGLYAVIMLASLTFYNIWYFIIRMYTCYVLAELLVLWVYFRLIFKTKTLNIRHYVALILSSLLFINTHIFSVIIFLAIGIYHIILPKNRKWLYITMSFMIAALIFSPWVLVLKEGYEIATGSRRLNLTSIALEWNEVFFMIFHLGLNGSIVFLGFLLVSLIDVIRKNRVAIALWMLTSVSIFLFLIVNEFTNSINLDRTRYMLPLFPLMILLIVKGLLAFQRWRIVIILAVVFWIASGLLFHRRIGYSQYTRTFSSFPLHYVERQLGNIFESGDLLVGFNSGVNYDFVGAYGTIIDLYFADYDIDIDFQHIEQLRYWEQGELHDYLVDLFAGHTTIWLVYETVDADNYLEAYHQALQSDYVQCSIDESIPTIVIENYQQGSCTS